MKKTMAIILTVITILTVLPFSAFAAKATSGKCGEHLTWSFNTSTGVLKIKGKGAMTDYNSGVNKETTAPWKKDYSSKIKTVEISSGVTSIGKFAFYGCTSLKKISMPDSINSVGYYAFAGCNSLKYNSYGKGNYLGNDKNPYLYFARLTDMDITEYKIHESTKLIGYDAFYFRISLTKVYIPHGVTSIGTDAFNKCRKLENVPLPESTTKIEQTAFAGCASLRFIKIPKSLKTLGNGAFDVDCELHYAGTQKEWNKITGHKIKNSVIFGYKEAYSSDFSDVPSGAWYEKSVKYCAENGFIGGMGDGIFNPLGELTREQFMQILFNFAGQHSDNWYGKTGFSDVPEGKWYSPAVKWAYSKKITSGVSAGKFGVGIKITREQFATLLMNYAAKMGKNTQKRTNLSKYKDAGKISDWALPAMKWAVAEKLISGTSKNTLSPETVANRATAATIFMNYNKWLKK